MLFRSSKTITGIWRTTALATAEAEAAILPAEVRWKRQRGQFWTDALCLPRRHPLDLTKRRAWRRTSRFRSPLMTMAGEFSMNGAAPRPHIEPYSRCPWQPSLRVTLDNDCTSALARAETPPEAHELQIYTDGSARNGLVGTGRSKSTRLNSSHSGESRMPSSA